MLLSLVLALGTLGLAAPMAHATGAVVDIGKDIDNKKAAYDKGDTVTYRLSISCSSQTDPCKTGTITDTLDPNLVYTSYTTGANPKKLPVELSQSGQTLTFTIGSATDSTKYLDDGDTLDIVVNAKIKSVPTNDDRTIPNQAFASTPDAPTPVDSDVVTITVNPAPDAVYDWGLQKKKVVPQDDPAVDGSVTYEVHLTRPRNSTTGTVAPGGVDLTKVVLADMIPAGATFVSAQNSSGQQGVYNSATQTITFPDVAVSAADGVGVYCWNGDPCTSYFWAQITVKYPSPTFGEGDQPVNKASADVTYADGHPNDDLKAEAKVTLTEPNYHLSLNKWNIAQVNPKPGDAVSWGVQAYNNGNTELADVTMVDNLPAGLKNVKVVASDWYMPSQVGSGKIQYSMDGTTWSTEADFAHGGTFDVPDGAKAVRVTVHNLPVNNYAGFVVQATVADMTAVGSTLNNCMNVDGTYQATGPCATYTVKEKDQATVTPLKSHIIDGGGDHLTPGTEFQWLLEWRTMAINDPKTSTVVDILPAGYELVTEEAPCIEVDGYWNTASGDSCAAGSATPAYTSETQADGTTKITFADIALPTRPDTVNYKYRIRLHVLAKDGVAAGTYTNTMSVSLPTDVEASCTTGAVAPAPCLATNSVVVDTAAAAGLQKWDKGSEPNVTQSSGQASSTCPDWDGFTRYPCVAQTLPGGDFTYRLRWSNQGNVPLNNAIVYDILPIENDTPVSQALAGQSRGTEWRPVLTGPITLDSSLSDATGSGYVIEYNTSANPCRPELATGSADNNWQASCDDTWTTSVADWSTVKSFRIKAYQGATDKWTPGTKLVFVIPMVAPADAAKSTISPLDLSVAWNSAGQRVFQVKDDGSKVRLLASEPRKVGIIIPAPYVSIGDYVWYDANGNGQQDAGELPAKQLTVTLKDKDGNVVGTTKTDDDGYYWFQNLTEKANYTLVFDKPSGYDWTTQNLGDDKTDSDVNPETSTISFTAPTWVQGVSKNLGGHNIADDPTLDAGLIQHVGSVTVGDYVWKDTNGNGIQDAGEPGIQGVVLKITDETGATVKNVLGADVGPVTTDANGKYLFPLLPIGHTYTVTIDETASATALAGLVPTLANQGGDTAKDSSTGSATSVPMSTDGQKDLTLDFGFIEQPLVSVGDYVWYDTNRDGLQTSGEQPYTGMTVQLFKGTDTTVPALQSTTTNSAGYYSFQNLDPSTQYTIKFVKAADESFTTKDASGDSSNSATADLTDSDANVTDGTVTFTSPATGQNKPSTSADSALADNPGIDAGIVRYNLKLDKALVTTGTIRPGQDVTYTLTPSNDGPVDAQGNWSVTDLLPAGLTIKSMTSTDAKYTCTLADDKQSGTCVNSGVLGAKQSGAVITVVATVGAGTSGTLKNVAYVDKASSDLPETVPLIVPTLDKDTSNKDTDNDDEAVITLAPLVSIGDYVWYDSNRDGVQQTGEPVYAGMTVDLYPATGDMTAGNRIATTVTDLDGYYYFQDLEANTAYRVKFVKADTESFTAQTQGSDTKVDSNPAVDTGIATVTTPGSGYNKTGHGEADDPTIDAGIVKYNLQLKKTLDTAGPFIPGQTVTYTLVPSNDGPVTALAGWSVTEIMPAGLTLVSMTGKDYDCTGATCTGKYELDQGDGNAITVTATINEGFHGTAHNVAYVSPKDGDIVETNPLVKPDGTTDTDKTNTDNDAQADLKVDLVSIGDYVWWDANRNGLQDQGEAPVVGATVQLLTLDNMPIGNTVVTNAQGYYEFTNLSPGKQYKIQIVGPAGSTWTTQNASHDTSNDPATDKTDSDVSQSDGTVVFTTPTSGSNGSGGFDKTDNPTLDAGLVKYNLTLAKSLDTAGPFYVGKDVTYTLTPHNDGPVAALPGWSVTDILPAGLTFKSMTSTDASYTCSGATCTNNAALAANSDGPAIIVVATVKADITGVIHNVAYVAPSKDDVAETVPLGDVPTTGTDTSTTTTDNDAQADLTVNKVSIGDYVWWDANRDGQQTAGEPFIDGVTVNLIKDGKVAATTTTKDGGYYAFGDLYPHTAYTVEFVKPDGSTFTTQTQGATGSDSNPDVATGKADVVTPDDGSNSLLPNKADDPTIDAGLVKYNLTLAKSLDTAGPFIPGQTVTYTLTPHNDGPVAALAGWSVTEVIPAQFDSMAMVGDGYTCDGRTCTAAAPLAAGADGNKITVTATLKKDILGKIHNVAYVAPVAGDIVETNVLVVPDSTTDTSATPTDNDAQADLDIVPVSIGDYVWMDDNRNGQQDSGETPVPHVTVKLMKDGQEAASTATNDNGYYAFKDLYPGTDYTVVFVKPSADTSFTYRYTGAAASDSNADNTTGEAPVTTPKTGNNLIAPTKADDPTIDAGLVKFNLTLAKTLDTAKPYVPNQTITFTLVPHNDGPSTALKGWTVTEIVPSQLTLVSMSGAGYACSGTVCTADAALAGNANGGPITVTATINADALGDIHNVAYVTPSKDDVTETNPLVVPDTNTDTSASGTDNDAQASLRVQPVSIGDYVWWDVNRNGQQDSNEPAVPGVTVILHNADGSVKATTVTGDDGYYAFTTLQPHTDYTVEFVKPEGTTFTYQLTGATASDSNANVTTGYTPKFTTPSEGSNLADPGKADDPTIDAGLWSQINLVLDKHLATDSPFVQGDEVTFYLSPSNEGPMDALAGWSVTEVLPEGLTLVSMTGDGYICADVTCTASAQLAAGATGKPIKVVAKINDKAYGKVHNVAYVSPAKGEIPESNPLDVPGTDTNTARTRTDNDAQAELRLEPPAISLNKIAHLDDFNGNGYADAGETIHYTFKVTNIGGVRLAPVTISDQMLGLNDADCVDSLGVGETATCSTTGSYTVTSDDIDNRRSIDNTATTTGRVPGTHDKVYSTDDETVPVGHRVLPQTGGDIPLWAGIGAPLLLVAGAGLLFVGRRGRRTAGSTK